MSKNKLTVRSNSSSSSDSSSDSAQGRKMDRIVSKESIKSFVKPKPENVTLGKMDKFDACVFLIHCPTHEKVLLATAENHFRWLPFTKLQANQSWREGALGGFCLVLTASFEPMFDAIKCCPPWETVKCLQVMRFQLPQTQKFITRVTYYFKLKASSPGFTCCQPIAPHLEWFPLASILKEELPLPWGPEVVQFSKLIATPGKMSITEFCLDEVNLFVPRSPPCNAEEDMLLLLGITQTQVERLYGDFLNFCYPSFYLTSSSFQYCMATFKLVSDLTVLRLFDAFNYTRSGHISFHELLLGLACIDPKSDNELARFKFIFRYYDTQKTGRLEEAQLRALFKDMGATEQVEATLQKLAEVNGDLTLTEDRFLAAIEVGHLPSTAALCRSSKAMFFGQISGSIASGSAIALGCDHLIGKVLIKRSQDSCQACLENKYDMATHLVVFDAFGQQSCKRLAKVEVPANFPEESWTLQRYSIECVFQSTSTANTILKLVRQFNANKGTISLPRGLLQNSVQDLWKLLLALYDEADTLLQKETKCQRLSSPCYVIGDIHGNIEDLLSMERTVWPQVPCLGANYLFLGDYVDRGKWGFECAIYLLAFKILCPNKVTLLRGNHEVRRLQIDFSYKKELLIKYGERYGLRIWELTNRLFDKMPVCATVDESIFCAHGGIPKSAKTIEQINAIPGRLTVPDKEDIAWEILWSDPADRQEFVDTCATMGVDSNLTEGFVHNNKRNTAFKFNEDGAASFLNTNMLDLMIRAHEVVPDGFAFHFGTKCATIFSSSHYCGDDNASAVMLADNQRLRVLTIDTANNKSATDAEYE